MEVERSYWFDLDEGKTPNEEAMLAKLLDESVLFSNSRKYLDLDGKTVMPETIVLFVVCNDTFCMAADAETVTLGELPALFDMYMKDPVYGVILWVMAKRKEQPMKETKEAMIQKGIWKEEFDGFEKNRF